MEYKIWHLIPGGEIELCGNLNLKADMFTFQTEIPELAEKLSKIQKQGFVLHYHDSQSDKPAKKIKPGDVEFIKALEEYLGNYRIRTDITST